MTSSQMVGMLLIVAILLLDSSQSYTVNARPRGSVSNGGQTSTASTIECFTFHNPTAAGRKRLKALSRPQIEDDDFNEVSISKMKNMIKRIFRKKAEPGTLMLVSRDLGVYSHRLSSSCMNVLHYSLLK